jgi:outer membrane translocation and assembly module TamA
MHDYENSGLRENAMRTFGRVLAGLVCLVGLAWGQCSVDHRTDKKAGILVQDVAITGTKAISATELAGMTSDLIGGCFDEDSDEMEARVRAGFQELGYFKVEVKNVRLKAGDPLGVPKPVTMEAEVEEGSQYRVGEISFLKNRAFSSGTLREEFPMKVGDVFSRGKVAAGLEGLRKLYGRSGYLDYTCIPETVAGSNGIMNLKLMFDEGPQYRLEKVEFVGKKEVTARLGMEWKLETGSVYDNSYLSEFIEANRDLLPTGFTRGDVQVAKDCPKALVEVRVVVDAAEDAGKTPAKEVPCEKDSKEK